MAEFLPAYEHHGKPVSREAFYAIACDPARSVAVEACAGAGKTWMLVSRMLRALLDGAAPHEILAITFTKKAAGEMRQRLQEWLAEFAHASPQVLQGELVARGVGAAAAQGQAQALRGLYRTVLAAGRPVQIRTFHSWFASLLRSAPLAVVQQLGLPLNYELLEDDSSAIAQVWRRFNAALLEDAAAREDYLAVVARYGRFQTGRALEGALSKRVEFALADAQGCVDASVLAFGEQFPEFSGCAAPQEALLAEPGRSRLLAAARALGRASAVTFSAKGSELEQAVTNGEAAGVFDALLTQKQEPRKFSEKLAGIEAVREAQELAVRVLAAQAQHEAWRYQQAMARLARVLLEQYAALKRERGWVDMNDVERAAQVLLADPVLSGWVQQRLDAKVRHLLIDEFQDTNPLQWQALHAWLAGYAGAGGGGGGAPSVFLVGDPKQSIYRFRRAEPQVFRAAQRFVVEGLGGDLLSCDHTRRNASAVIDAVNAVMLAAQAAGEYEDFRAHSTESQAHGAVLALPAIGRDAAKDAARGAAADGVEESWGGEAGGGWRDSLATPRSLPEDTLRSLECRQAAQWIAAQLQAGLRPQDVMVLARKRDRLSAMQDELRRLHIPSQQPEKTALGEAPEVQDVVALLDALVSPGHDLSLARALRSPLFGCSDEALAALAEARRDALRQGERPSWFDLLQKTELHAPVLPALGSMLMRWKHWVDTLPPHDALDAIYHDGDVLARFAAAAPAALREGCLANLRAVLSAALQLDGGRYATPYALVRALKGAALQAPASADARAVRLLTVHGAKGLEAPLVLLLDTDAAPARAETMGVLVDWPGEAASPRRFVFLASETRPPACSAALLQTEQAARRREELNALYVAMTRARSRLALSSIEPHRAQEGSWRARLEPQAEALAAPEAAGAQQSADAPVCLAVLPVLPDELLPKAVEEAQPDSLDSRIGKAMHRLLERAPLGVQVLEPAFVAAAAREFALDARQGEQAAQMAARILAGAGAWAWDARQLAWHGNEVALLHQGQLFRLDRLVRRREDGHWWVLDYKSAAQPLQRAELVAQLQGYRAAVRAAEPQAVVRVAFLTAKGELVEVLEGNGS